jgi:hypothetical protein
MTSARLGALMTNAGRTADGGHINPTCTCCHTQHDTARHVLLQCQALASPRDQMWELLMRIWDEDQQEEFAEMSEQQQYMTLLGKQMENELDMNQQKLLDKTVKHTLVKMDDVRKLAHDLQPMNGTTHNRPPEQSIQLTEQWRQMADQRSDLRAQQLLTDSDEECTDLRAEIAVENPDGPDD